MKAITDAKAKTGNFPFTTIKPNTGICYSPMDCPCKKYNKMDQCQPRYGRCEQGIRYLPIKILDVAGLVPGASTGEGLGNQFLDDLRTAQSLIHVVDVSGTTDACGKETVGYDPINDIDWLKFEIHNWIYSNLQKKWGSIVRRHIAVKASTAETLQNQFSGYGSNISLVNRFLSKMKKKTPLNEWSEDDIHECVDAFLDERFPMIIALNKIDLPDSDKNIDRICRKYDPSKIVLISALSELFLKKLSSQGFIHYKLGTDEIELAQDQSPHAQDKLKPMDDKTLARLEKVQDLVLFRYWTTGTQECVKKAVDSLGLIPVFPVRNIHNFTSASSGRSSGVFRDCLFVRPGTTVKAFAEMVHPDLYKYYQYAETVGGIRVFILFLFCISFTLHRWEKRM